MSLHVISRASEDHHRDDLLAPLDHLWGMVIAPSSDGVRGPASGRLDGHYSAPRLGSALRAQRSRVPVQLRTTVERAARLMPRERLAAVLTRPDSGSAAAAIGDVRWIMQPAWRGSAAEVFLAALVIAAEDPAATIALLPADHVCTDEDALLGAVASAARAVEIRPDVPIVIGARPRHAARSVWLEPGSLVDGLEAFGVRAVDRVIRDASADEVDALLDRDALHSTLVVVVRATALIDLGRAAVPDVLETLEPLEGVFGRAEEALLRDAVYESMPFASAMDVLDHADDLAVLAVRERVRAERPDRVLRLAS